ncbi:MAG: ABC transporter substrate-binding protein [Spirochaetales bacterium]|nr:ABC transporter substrate-binding protein [Spirochaetales bacterium]
MPYIKIQTNRTVNEELKEKLLLGASSLASGILGKPERYVMTALEAEVPMTFAGTAEPCAFIECKSVGLPESKTRELSAGLTGLVTEELDILPDRVYIEFADSRGSMWGWDGGTF